MPRLLGVLLSVGLAAPAAGAGAPPPEKRECDEAQQNAINPAFEGALERIAGAFQAFRNMPPQAAEAGLTLDRWRAGIKTNLAEGIFTDGPLSMTALEDRVRRIGQILADGSRFYCPSDRDRNCRGRGAYALLGGANEGQGEAAIYFCAMFFSEQSPESRARTVIHESAHLDGVGNPFKETYCPVIMRGSSCGGSTETADAWVHFIHLLSGRCPDEFDTRMEEQTARCQR